MTMKKNSSMISMKPGDFQKKMENAYNKSKKKLNETKGLQVSVIGEKSGTFFININGHAYGYKPEGMSMKNLIAKFNKLKTFSVGKALAWLKKNSKLVSGSTKKMEEIVLRQIVREMIREGYPPQGSYVKDYTISGGNFGIDTYVQVHTDGIILEQKQGSSRDRIFLTEKQVKQLKFR